MTLEIPNEFWPSLQQDPQFPPPEGDGFTLPTSQNQNPSVQDLCPKSSLETRILPSLTTPFSQGQLPSPASSGPPQLYQDSSLLPPSLLWPAILESDQGIIYDQERISEPIPCENGDRGKETIFTSSSQGSEDLQRSKGKVETADINTIKQSMKDSALEIIQKQKACLYKEGEQIFEQLIELHQLAVYLEITPQDSYLYHLLLNTKKTFLSSFQIPRWTLSTLGKDRTDDSHVNYDSCSA
ncbi:hypothetical protein McaMca56_008167 [Microsporum canis]